MRLAVARLSRVRAEADQPRSTRSGYNNPPTAADSLLPIQSTSKDGSGATGDAVLAPVKSNKRRKRSQSAAGGAAPSTDYGGVSKSAFR